jgi:hypothetical protein
LGEGFLSEEKAPALIDGKDQQGRAIIMPQGYVEISKPMIPEDIP